MTFLKTCFWQQLEYWSGLKCKAIKSFTFRYALKDSIALENLIKFQDTRMFKKNFKHCLKFNVKRFILKLTKGLSSKMLGFWSKNSAIAQNLDATI